MNLIKEYLGSIAGVQIFAIISMLIFLITFLFMLFQTYSIAKDRVREYSRLPLEEDNSGSDKD
jgi:cytochrome c oxidase cbb3-type subunit IV